MWRNTEKEIDSKYVEESCKSDNDIDSGFLSGSQHTVEISDIRPAADLMLNTESQSKNLDSGYIDDENTDVYTNQDKFLKKSAEPILINSFNKLNIGSSTEDCKISNLEKVFTDIPDKEKWEIYYQQNDDGDTKLHLASLTGSVDVVAALIRMTPHPCLLDIQNDNAQTALHIAACINQPKIIRMLLIAGADPTLQDRNGNTALHMACICGNIQCVKALMENINACELKEAHEVYMNPYLFGSSKTTLSRSQIDMTKIINTSKSTLEIRNYDGERCVHLATQGNFIDILRQLINYGADINSREGKSGRTPLHIAIQQKNENVANFLLEEGLKFNLNLEICTYAGITAFQFACILQNQTLQKILKEIGAESDIPDSDSDVSDVENNLDNSYLSLVVN